MLLSVAFISSCQDSSSPNAEKPIPIDTVKKDTVIPINPIDNSDFFIIDSIVPTAVGESVTDFFWRDKDSIYSFKKAIEGKFILLNFWKLHCQSCIEEMPNLKRIAEEYKSKGLYVIGLNCDVYQVNPDSSVNYLREWADQEMGLNYINLHSYIYPVKYGIFLLPTTIVIDKSGKVVDTLIGESSYEFFKSRIDKHLQ